MRWVKNSCGMGEMVVLQLHHPQSHYSLKDLLIVLIWHHIPTPRNWPSLQEYTGFDTHLTAPQPQGMSGWADIDNC